jgi:hypothetical protein
MKRQPCNCDVTITMSPSESESLRLGIIRLLARQMLPDEIYNMVVKFESLLINHNKE